MAITVRSDLSKTVSSLNLNKWPLSSGELQGIQVENKTDEGHKSLILINVHMHSSTCTAGGGWYFLEETEDKLKGTSTKCGDFNAQLSLWDQHDTNKEGCALEEALSDMFFTPVSTASSTHLSKCIVDRQYSLPTAIPRRKHRFSSDYRS